MKRILIIFILFVFSNAYGAPAITGTSGEFSSGETFTLTVTSPGTGATIHKWDDFEGGTHTVGNTIGAGPGSTAWAYLDHERAVDPLVSNATNRTNSTKFIRCDFDSVVGNSRCNFNYVHGGNITQAYLTWYFRWNNVGSASSPNQKPFWPLCNGNSGTITQPRVSAASFYDSNYNWIVNSGTNSDQIDETPPTENDWVRFEIYGEESSDGVEDGTIIISQQDSEGVVFDTIWNDETQETTDNGNHWLLCIFGDYVAGGTNVHVQNDFDDVYIASSRARVELGNNSTYTSCTNREIQPHSSWGASSITITVNTGTFAAEDTAYLFVIDEDGAISDAEEITIGGVVDPPESTIVIGSTLTKSNTGVSMTKLANGANIIKVE